MVDSVGLQTGLAGSEAALQQALAGALSGLSEGTELGRSDLQPFAQAGQGAAGLQAALTGASGAQAQEQALSNFASSPGQQFLRDQAEKALLRNSAAIGGLGGGNVRQALQEQAVGLASQDFGNMFSRLSQVAGQGLQAAGGQSQLAGAAGRDAANLAFQTGQSLSGGRTQAGEQIASAIGGTTSALSNLINQQGAGLADILGTSTGNLANILAGAGTAQGASQTALATLLANIAAGQGSQSASLPSVGGVQQSGGNLQGVGQLASGIGSLFSAFA